MSTEATSGSSPLNALPPVCADTSELNKKGKGTIVLSSSETGTEKLTIAGKLAKTSAITNLMRAITRKGPEEPTFAKLKNDVVLLNLMDQSKKNVRVEVKVEDLANLLKINPDKLRKFDQEGVLGDFAHGKLHGQLIEQNTPKGESDATKEASLTTKKDFSSANIKDQLNPEHVRIIDDFYKENFDLLNRITEPRLYHRDEVGLPYSVVFVPNDPGRGIYVLLKTHEGHKEIGVGSFNRATLAIKWDTGEKKVFRNAAYAHVPQNELQANKELVGDSKHFSVGVPVEYSGVLRPREGREKNVDFKSNPKYARLQGEYGKLGFLMDWEEGGDLYERLVDSSLPILNEKQRGTMAQEYTEAIAALHKKGLTHNDQKPENIFLTKDGHVKLADFGCAAKSGETVWGGSPGYMAPEFAIPMAKKEDDPQAKLSADIWGMGCVFATMYDHHDWTQHCTRLDWKNMNVNVGSDDLRALDQEMLEIFPYYDDPTHSDYIIALCLQTDPSLRPTAEEVLNMWKNFNATGSCLEEFK